MPIQSPSYRFAALVSLAVLLACPIEARAQNTPIDPTTALQYFQEAQAASERDSGRLWGMSLYGPLLFVDPKTRAVVANQGDHEGLLTQQGEVYVGRLPENVPVANYAATWGRVKWAMIVWPFLTKDRFQRVKLMAHESFHRVQNELLLSVAKPNNDHLDTAEGRIWLELEWRALQKALTSSGAARRSAVEDALTFRDYRRSLFPEADLSERAAEIREGMAEYTGFRVSAKDNAALLSHLTKAMEAEANRPTFVESFACSSGPAYAVLLDGSDAHWRRGLTPQQDLGELVQRALKIELAPDLKAAAEKQALSYGGEALRATEAVRDEKRRQQIAEERQRFLAGPTLLIPLSDKRSITVVSADQVPIDGVGTMYPTSRIIDEWGTLQISKGALMIRNDSGRIVQVYLSPPTDPKGQPLNGAGWTLQLTPGWRVVPGSREGDFYLQKQ